MFLGTWRDPIDDEFFNHMDGAGAMNYNTMDAKDLLRFIRNSSSHHYQVPDHIKVKYKLGVSEPVSGLNAYFRKKFPTFMLMVYKFVCEEYPNQLVSFERSPNKTMSRD